MSVKMDCRHYIVKTVPNGEKIERCRFGANEQLPFGCPDGCVFYEQTRTSHAGWPMPKAGEPES